MLEFIEVVITVTYVIIGIGASIWASLETQEEARRKKIPNTWRWTEAILITLFWPILLIAGAWKALDETLSEIKEEHKNVQEQQ